MPKCAVCGADRPRGKFSTAQLKKAATKRRCLQCIDVPTPASAAAADARPGGGGNSSSAPADNTSSADSALNWLLGSTDAAPAQDSVPRLAPPQSGPVASAAAAAAPAAAAHRMIPEWLRPRNGNSGGGDGWDRPGRQPWQKYLVKKSDILNVPRWPGDALGDSRPLRADELPFDKSSSFPNASAEQRELTRVEGLWRYVSTRAVPCPPPHPFEIPQQPISPPPAPAHVLPSVAKVLEKRCEHASLG